MIIYTSLNSEKDIRELEHFEKTSNNQISDFDKSELINRIVLDKRLTAGDIRVYIFLLNFSSENYTQEEIAQALSMSRMNISRSIKKLVALNYLSIDKEMLKTATYNLVGYKEAGIIKVNIENLIKLFNLTLKDNKKIEYSELENNWNNFNNVIRGMDLHISKNAIESILSIDSLKLILFIAYANTDYIKTFKENYLNEMIGFYDKFALRLDESFLEVFYNIVSEGIKNKEYSIDEIISAVGIPHSNDTKVVKRFKEDMKNKIYTWNSIYHSILNSDYMKEVEFPEELEYINRTIDLNSKKYTLNEFLTIVYMSKLEHEFEEKVNMLFLKFTRIFNENLFNDFILSRNMINKFYSLK